MKRRAFIRTGLVVSAVAGAAGSSAFGEIIIPTEENVTHPEMERFLEDMDVRMERISSSGGEHIQKLISHTPDESEQRYFRSSLRSLLLVGSFGELPIKGQTHPWMQKRLMHSASEVDFSVSSSYDMLRNMSDESMEAIRIAFANDPRLGNRIMDTLDLEAKSIGVSSARRRQMKGMSRRIIRRLKHSPEMFIDEYVKKTEKLLLASNSDEALDRMFKMQAGEARYSAYSKEAEIAALHWKRLSIPDMSVGYGSMTGEKLSDPETIVLGNSKPINGLKLLGLGVVITAAGGLLIAIGMTPIPIISEVSLIVGIILGVTVGPLLILTALIILLIDAIISAINKLKSRE